MSFAELSVLHFAATLFMTGLIWFVQVVHYALFAFVGERAFRTYEAEHVRRTTWVVLPPMVAELGLAIWLFTAAPAGVGAWTTTGLVLVLSIWIITFAEQVPCHSKLQERADPAVMRRLVRGNWLRTAAWSARAVVAAALLWPPAA